MQIECKIKRKGGSQVTLGDETYDFQPDKQGRHVAEVSDPDHVDRLLEIDAYVALEGGGQAAPGSGGDESEKGQDGGDGEQYELAKAREAYREQFGKAPHHAMKADTIWKKLEEGSP